MNDVLSPLRKIKPGVLTRLSETEAGFSMLTNVSLDGLAARLSLDINLTFQRNTNIPLITNKTS